MTPLLRSELIKLRTTRTFAALAAVAVGTSLLITGLVAALTEPTKDTVLYDVFATDTSSLFILVLAVIGISGEWRHRTITSSLLAAPNRFRFLAAKTLAFATAGGALSVLISVSVAALAATILPMRDLPLPEAGELAALVAGNALVAAALAVFGVALGALIRNQIVAVVALLVLMFVVEPLVLSLAPAIGRFAPLSALPPAITGTPPEDVGLNDIELLGWVPATAVLAVWLVLALAVATTLLQRRDLE